MEYARNITIIVSETLRSTKAFSQIDKWGIVLSGVIAIFFAIPGLFQARADRSGPAPAPSHVPFLGHSASYGRDRSGLFDRLRRRTRRPFPYTLTLFYRKVHLFFHPRDAETMWNNSETLSWEIPAAEQCRVLYGLSEEDKEKLTGNPGAPEEGVLRKFMHLNANMMKHSVEEGGMFKPMVAGFITQNEAAVSELLRTVDEEGTIQTDLHFWVMDYVTRVGMSTIWGERNPYAGTLERKKKDELVSSIFHFDDSWSLMLGGLLPLPRWFHKDTIKARENVVTAFKAFYADPSGNLSPASADLVLKRTEAANELEMSIDGLARMDFALLHSSIQNTRPVSFWCLYYLYSTPAFDEKRKLVDDIRNELKNTSSVELEEATGRLLIDIPKLVTSCRILNSFWNEVLRFHHDFTYTKRIVRETKFEDYSETTFKLHRGNDIQVPSGTMMRDPWIWGETADEFDPYRFGRDPKAEKEADEEKFEMRKQAFRPFGGGERHCPGRGVAWVEVATLIATFAIMFDLEILKKGGMDTRSTGLQMVCPVGECRVKLRRSDFGKKVKERVYIQP